MPLRSSLVIFVPGYNVAKTIGTVMEKLAKIQKVMSFDILYVDNCSTDGSPEIVAGLAGKQRVRNLTIVKNSHNLGYGGSQKVAFRHAFARHYRYLIEYDGDLQYPLEAIPGLYDAMLSSHASIVFGSRVTSSENLQEMPRWKQWGNRMLNRINNWAFSFGVSEIHTGFRIYDLEKLRGMNLDACHDDYRWTLDSVVEAMKVNHRFAEIPVSGLYHKDASAPSIRQLMRVTSYMVCRGFCYKLFGR